MLLRVCIQIFFLFVLQMHFLDCNSELVGALNKTRKHRQKRTLYFPYYSGYAVSIITIDFCKPLPKLIFW